jgi:hypothetical protein
MEEKNEGYTHPSASPFFSSLSSSCQPKHGRDREAERQKDIPPPLSSQLFVHGKYLQWYMVHNPYQWIPHVQSMIRLRGDHEFKVDKCIVVETLINLLSDFFSTLQERKKDTYAYNLLTNFLSGWLHDDTCDLRILSTKKCAKNIDFKEKDEGKKEEEDDEKNHWFPEWTRCFFTDVPVLVPFHVHVLSQQEERMQDRPLVRGVSDFSYVFDGFALLIKVINDQVSGCTLRKFIHDSKKMENLSCHWELWDRETRPFFVNKKRYIRYCAWIHRIDIGRFLKFLDHGLGIVEEPHMPEKVDEKTCIMYPWKWACRIYDQPLTSLFLDKGIHSIAKWVGYTIEYEKERDAIAFLLSDQNV